MVIAAAFAMGAPATAQHLVSAAGTSRAGGDSGSSQAVVVRNPIVQSHPVLPASERTPAWSAALSRYGEERIRHAYDLASRGAIHTAQHELHAVLRAVAQALDADQGTERHAQSLIWAQIALEEAEDFLKTGPQGTRHRSVADIAAAHRTPLLHGEQARPVTAVVALQLYYSHAIQHFVLAAGGQPVASDVLYALGRIVSILRDHPSGGERDATPLVEQKMLLFYRAAWTVNPRNHRARNEYGVLLARFNQWPQACEAFEYSVAQSPDVQNTRNLAIAYERLGEPELAAQARQFGRSLSTADASGTATKSGSPSARVVPAVEWVDLGTFTERGSPAGWSSFAPRDGSPGGLGNVDSPEAGQKINPLRTTTDETQPTSAKRRRLFPSSRLNRLKSVFKRE